MAEFVQLRKEKWTEPLLLLRKLRLFSSSELSQIIKQLENFEYKIQTPNRKLEDVLKYVEFECNLLKLLTQRRKIAEQFEKTDEIDKFIYSEIYLQFGSAEITFQHRIEYWNARLKFIADIVPNENREVEFNRIFRKALDYCGKAHLSLYKDCVIFMWTFLPAISVKKPSKKKARLLRERKNVSRIMSTIRETTKEALRNFPRDSNAFIWVITTELQYLIKLLEEEELSQEAIQVETENTEKLIKILTRNVFEKFKEPKVYFRFFDAIKTFSDSLPQASHLLKRITKEILSIQPRTLEVFSWLIEKSIEERKVDECLERVNQALSSSLSKVRTLEMCLEKLDKFFDCIVQPNDQEDCLPKLVEFYLTLLDKNNSDWSQVRSEIYHVSRIKFLKRLPKLKVSETSFKLCDRDELLEKINTFLENNPLRSTVIASAKQFPSSLFLVRERLLEILQTKGDTLKPPVIFKYLKDLNLRRLSQDEDKQEEVRKLLYVVYYTFVSSPRLAKQIHKLLSVPGTEEIRLIHMKKLYIERMEEGRSFYRKYRDLSTDWRLAHTVIEIETNICRSRGLSSELEQAIIDATRLARTSSTEPWKDGVMSYHRLKEESKASNLLQRALKLFSAENEQGEKHKDLIMFAKSYQL